MGHQLQYLLTHHPKYLVNLSLKIFFLHSVFRSPKLFSCYFYLFFKPKYKSISILILKIDVYYARSFILLNLLLNIYQISFHALCLKCFNLLLLKTVLEDLINRQLKFITKIYNL